MHYLVATTTSSARLPAGTRTVAGGEMLSFEQPWTFGAPLLVRLDDGVDLDALKSNFESSATAFAVEGFAEPGSGQAFVIAAHKVRDPEGFAPYAAAVPDVIKHYGCRFLARGGKVTPLAGSFAPDRVVLIEFPTVDDLIAFYFSDAYAPLLEIRLATTEPRFVLVMRSGAIPDAARAAIATKLQAHA